LNRVKKTGFIDKPKGDCTIALVHIKGDGLLVDLYNAVKTWCGYKWDKTIVQGNNKVITFGSGGNFAYGAFMGGLSAEESVVAASKCDIYTSREYDVVEL
jgi:ATP-dependent protease HslVU (ClpYQ), peptidase subunit